MFGARSQVLVAALLALCAAAAFISCGEDEEVVEMQIERLAIEEVNNSGYAGELVLASPRSNQTWVLVAVGQGDEPGGDFPVVIQRGSCEGESGEVVYDLGSLENGLLNEEIPAAIDDLTEEDYALVIFDSPRRALYVACAAI